VEVTDMANRLKEWIKGKRSTSGNDRPATGTLELEDVTPQHPEEYPARHLKEMLDTRRSRFAGRASEPTGMPDGPGPLT
jgi:hypothetical protein